MRFSIFWFTMHRQINVVYQLVHGGPGGIRTPEGVSQQIYSLPRLTASVPTQIINATYPLYHLTEFLTRIRRKCILIQYASSLMRRNDNDQTKTDKFNREKA